MLPNPEEKRQHPRIDMRVPLTYRVRGKPISESTISTDLSAGGLSFISEKFLPIQTVLGLEFNILSRSLSSSGQIKWISPVSHSDRNRIGIQFMELPDAAKDYLSNYINGKRRL